MTHLYAETEGEKPLPASRVRLDDEGVWCVTHDHNDVPIGDPDLLFNWQIMLRTAVLERQYWVNSIINVFVWTHIPNNKKYAYKYTFTFRTSGTQQWKEKGQPNENTPTKFEEILENGYYFGRQKWADLAKYSKIDQPDVEIKANAFDFNLSVDEEERSEAAAAAAAAAAEAATAEAAAEEKELSDFIFGDEDAAGVNMDVDQHGRAF